MTLFIHNPITAALGILAHGVVAPRQLHVMHQAGDAPEIASAANTSPSPSAQHSASGSAAQPSTGDGASPRSTGRRLIAGAGFL
ncbi:hypothetical protein [Nocardia sputi]|uniref:hypothetical protein n=1 Tax=Nocardia sputi TaxID=2943705 RepID=UPI0020BFB9EB|nr:hypothetical protein [Nocardia sputi]